MKTLLERIERELSSYDLQFMKDGTFSLGVRTQRDLMKLAWAFIGTDKTWLDEILCICLIAEGCKSPQISKSGNIVTILID